MDPVNFRKSFKNQYGMFTTVIVFVSLNTFNVLINIRRPTKNGDYCIKIVRATYGLESYYLFCEDLNKRIKLSNSKIIK